MLSVVGFNGKKLCANTETTFSRMKDPTAGQVRNNEVLNNKAVKWVREDVFVKVEPNMMAKPFCGQTTPVSHQATCNNTFRDGFHSAPQCVTGKPQEGCRH